MRNLYSGFTVERWERVLAHPYFKKSLEATVKAADAYMTKPIEIVQYSQLHLFELTGNRSEFETPYNSLNRRADILFTAYMITKDDKYITPLIDAIWQICNLESWSLSAHVKESESLEKRRGWLELCSTNVGRRLAEMLALIEDKLPELVVRRLKHEIRERTIEAYKKFDFHWCHGTNNWSAVCIAGVLGAYLYVAEPEEIEQEIPRMCECIDGYISGFDSAGCCAEGYGYWKYGMKYFCLFAEMLKNYTNGRIDYFKNPKVHKIAKFQENIAINDTECVRFSDCNRELSPEGPLTHLLKAKYPDIQIPSIPAPEGCFVLHEYCWLEPDYSECRMQPKSCIYSENQWFIHRGRIYNFACKAGCNREPHNHLDVGSFLISKNNEVTFTDPGGGDYTRQYFDQSVRYTILEPSAKAHSVPIINGNYEVLSDKKSKVYVESEHEYAFSMENAYDDKTLLSLKRHFVTADDALYLTDTYEFNKTPESVVENFVTLKEPKINREEGKIYCGATCLEYDKDVFDTELLSEISHRKNNVKEMLYMINLKVKEPKEKMTLTFKFT